MKTMQATQDSPSEDEQYKQNKSLEIQDFYQDYHQHYDYCINKNQYYYKQ